MHADLQTIIIQKSNRCPAQIRLENRTALAAAYASGPGNIRQGKLLRIVLIDIRNHLLICCKIQIRWLFLDQQRLAQQTKPGQPECIGPAHKLQFIPRPHLFGKRQKCIHTGQHLLICRIACRKKRLRQIRVLQDDIYISGFDLRIAGQKLRPEQDTEIPAIRTIRRIAIMRLTGIHQNSIPFLHEEFAAIDLIRKVPLQSLHDFDIVMPMCECPHPGKIRHAANPGINRDIGILIVNNFCSILQNFQIWHLLTSTHTIVIVSAHISLESGNIFILSL